MSRREEIERITSRWKKEKRIAAADVDKLLAWVAPFEKPSVYDGIMDAFFGGDRR